MIDIQELIDLYNDLDNALFFDGMREFHLNNRYTLDEWQTKAHQFLDCYHKVVNSNTEAARYHFLFKEKETEQKIKYTNISRNKDHTENDDNTTNELPEGYDIVDEPFDGYFELIRKMTFAKSVLSELSTRVIVIDPNAKIIQQIGNFKFVLNGKDVREAYCGETLLKLSRTLCCVFFCIMQQCYDNNDSVSMEEIKIFCQNKTYGEGYIRTMVSQINDHLRTAANKDKKSKFIISSPIDGPRMYRINYDFFS